MFSSPAPMLLGGEELWEWTEGEGRAWYGQVGRVQWLGGVLPVQGGHVGTQVGHVQLQDGDH